MVLITWIIRIVAILFVVRIVLNFLYNLSRSPSSSSSSTGPGPGRRPNQPATREGGHLVRDPQCGTYVPIGRAVREGSGDHAVYFCSETCRNAWAARKAG